MCEQKCENCKYYDPYNNYWGTCRAPLPEYISLSDTYLYNSVRATDGEHCDVYEPRYYKWEELGE